MGETTARPARLAPAPMSFKAELVIQGHTFAVQQFHWVIGQRTDELGRPDARVHGGTLEIELAAQPSELLEHWALSDTQRLDGAVHVMEPDSPTVRDKVKFWGAHCVGFQKNFQDAHAVGGMTMRLSLSANKLQCNEMEIDNHWPDA